MFVQAGASLLQCLALPIAEQNKAVKIRAEEPGDSSGQSQGQHGAQDGEHGGGDGGQPDSRDGRVLVFGYTNGYKGGCRDARQRDGVATAQQQRGTDNDIGIEQDCRTGDTK